MNKFPTLLFVAASLVCIPKLAADPLPVIIDTDIGSYQDDPCAIGILHQLMSRNDVKILAIVGSTKYEGIAMDIDVLNTYFGRSNIPIGVTKDPNAYSDPQGSQNWTETIRKRFSYKIRWNAEAEDAIRVYRRVLANAKNNSVSILMIGHFTNMANLLRSGRDFISNLTGEQLVRDKVKEVVAMAGEFPNSISPEWNIAKDIPSAQFVANTWPSPITFVGFEIAKFDCYQPYEKVNFTTVEGNPVGLSAWMAFHDPNNPLEPGCFDVVAAMILGQQVEHIYRSIWGRIEIADDGNNKWHLVENHSHRYMVPVNDTVRSIVVERIYRLLPTSASLSVSPLFLCTLSLSALTVFVFQLN